jgi:myo-inositol 2-dehydrogenase/D-chiro-inositol 1-dehydrogenase
VAVRSDLAEALPLPGGFQQRFGTAYLVELQTWVAAIERGEEPPGPSAWDGYAAAAVCEAAVASLEGGAPVDVTLADRPALV